MKKILFHIIVIALVLASCKKDGNNIKTSNGDVILINEGDFGHGHASLSVYDPFARVIFNDIFKSINGFGLGDVAQDLYLIGDTAFVVINNSQRIVVADAAHSFRYIDTIGMPGASPRFFLPVSGSKAYVTELYANKIWIINYHTHKVTGSIAVTGWTEQIIAYNGKIYILEKTAPNGAAVNKLIEIDPASDHITRSMDFSSEPNSFVLTDQNKFAILTSQQSSPPISASLNIVDPSSFTVIKKLDFASSRTPGYLRFSTFTKQLLFADNGIFTMLPADSVLPTVPSIISNNWYIYGLNINPANGDIYISDAIDFQQSSRIMRYSKNDTLINAFNAGIGTNGFRFK